jgi:hypothetical protein
MYRGERRASLMQKYGEEDVIKLWNGGDKDSTKTALRNGQRMGGQDPTWIVKYPQFTVLNQAK